MPKIAFISLALALCFFCIAGSTIVQHKGDDNNASQLFINTERPQVIVSPEAEKGNPRADIDRGTVLDTPPNDDCYDVTPEILLSGMSLTFTGNSTDATNDCSLIEYAQVWVAIETVEELDLTIDFCGTTPALYSIGNILTQCPCNTLIYAIDCDWTICGDENGTLHFYNVPAGTYYYPVYAGQDFAGPYVVHINAEMPAPPPANDNCVEVTPQLLEPGDLLTITGTSRSSTSDCDALINPDTNEPLAECWEAFQIEETMNITIDFCGSNPAMSGFVATVLSDCPCANFISCNSQSGFPYCLEHYNVFDFTSALHWENVLPGTYYYPILVSGGGGHAYTVHIEGKRPPAVDFSIDAPGSWTGNTYGAGNECGNLSYEDHIWEITIPSNGNWTFTLCNTSPYPYADLFDLYLGTDLCASDIATSALIYSQCPGQLPYFTVPLTTGVYYLDVEGDAGDFEYQLDVYREPTPKLDLSQTAIEGEAYAGGSDTELLTISNSDNGILTTDLVVMLSNPLANSQSRTEVAPQADRSGQWSYTNDPKDVHPLPGKTPYSGPGIILQGGDNTESAMVISSIPFSDDGTTDGYSDDYTEDGITGSPDVVYSYTPDVNGWIDISLCDGTYWDTFVYVYENSVTPGMPYRYSDYGCEVSGPSLVKSVKLTTGNTYYIVVDGVNAEAYGDYHINVTEGNPIPECGANAMFSQSPNMPFDEISGGNSSDEAELPWGSASWLFDNFVNAYGSITEVKFYGMDMTINGVSCTHSANTFTIVFCDDNYGMPGDTVALFNDVVATVTPTGWIWNLTYPIELAEYEVILPEPVSNINHGWIGIVGSSVGDDCFFYWQTAFGHGDGIYMQYGQGIGFTQYEGDCAFCLIGDYTEPWLTINDQTSQHLQIGPYGSVPINVNMNAATMNPGTYYANIKYTSNDPFNPIGNIPVTFVVNESGTYQYLPGDANMINGQWPPTIIGGDVTYLVGYFRGINGPCLVGGFYNSADANGDCSIIGSDVTRLVSYFRGISDIAHCEDYPPAWLVPDDCPSEAPAGWPNCEAVPEEE
jgi:hypothetical protein